MLRSQKQFLVACLSFCTLFGVTDAVEKADAQQKAFHFIVPESNVGLFHQLIGAPDLVTGSHSLADAIKQLGDLPTSKDALPIVVTLPESKELTKFLEEHATDLGSMKLFQTPYYLLVRKELSGEAVLKGLKEGRSEDVKLAKVTNPYSGVGNYLKNFKEFQGLFVPVASATEGLERTIAGTVDGTITVGMLVAYYRAMHDGFHFQTNQLVPFSALETFVVVGRKEVLSELAKTLLPLKKEIDAQAGGYEISVDWKSVEKTAIGK